MGSYEVCLLAAVTWSTKQWIRRHPCLPLSLTNTKTKGFEILTCWIHYRTSQNETCIWKLKELGRVVPFCAGGEIRSRGGEDMRWEKASQLLVKSVGLVITTGLVQGPAAASIGSLLEMLNIGSPHHVLLVSISEDVGWESVFSKYSRWFLYVLKTEKLWVSDSLGL